MAGTSPAMTALGDDGRGCIKAGISFRKNIFMRFRDIPMHTPKAAIQAAIDPARRQRVTGGPRA